MGAAGLVGLAARSAVLGPYSDLMGNVVPAWAYEAAEVWPHDPRWSDLAVAECALLAELQAPWLVDGVEHVGSTAVPGLAAKPILDLMASVTDPDVVVAHASEQLSGSGWCYVSPSLDRRPWRRFFVKPDVSGRRRAAHLHVIAFGHSRWDEQLTFRDALRRDDRLALQYAQLKRRLANKYADNRESYTNAKSEFVAETLRRHGTASVSVHRLPKRSAGGD